KLIEQKQPLNNSEQYQALATAQQLIMSSEQQLMLTQQQSISRLAVHTLEPVFIDQHQGCGLFLELQLSNLAQLTPMLTQAHQTLTVWGVESNVLKSWLASVHTGLDRVMPVGQALSFSPDWDGVNLIEQFSRKVQCSF
ncbi:MAG TPA: acyl-CoA reductase, partial [Rheinheimera sp.]|nr:acyl-CoA reductase [Rheinheimera sp.]